MLLFFVFTEQLYRLQIIQLDNFSLFFSYPLSYYSHYHNTQLRNLILNQYQIMHQLYNHKFFNLHFPHTKSTI